MSWEGHCDFVQGRYSDGIDAVGIFGLDGRAWVNKSYDCPLGKIPETLVKEILNEIGKFEKEEAPIGGVHWGDLKFTSMKVEVYDADQNGKKFTGKRNDNGNIYAHTSKTCITVAHGKEGSLIGVMSNQVDSLRNYLWDNNY